MLAVTCLRQETVESYAWPIVSCVLSVLGFLDGAQPLAANRSIKMLIRPTDEHMSWVVR